jgi:hypothetical protein
MIDALSTRRTTPKGLFSAPPGNKLFPVAAKGAAGLHPVNVGVV